jgi:ATP-dependent DNA helicase RecG
MTKEDYMYLHNKNNPTSWEGLTSSDCTLRDLDSNRIKEVVREAVFAHRLPATAMTEKIPEILKKFGLIKNEKLTNAAVILFCKNERKQFMQSYINLARFRGTDKTVFLDTKMIKGNAFDLYDKALDYLHFALPVAAHIEPGNPNRVEEPAIPYKVLREALANALVHRDYSNAGGAIAIAIYDDRVNINNIGSLPKGIRLKELSEEHPSIQRNPLIAHVFYVSEKIEKWGRGTIDMIQDCKKAGNPAPKYKEIGDSFSITLPLREPIACTIISSAPPVKLTDRQQEIMKILKQGSLSRKQIISKMKNPPSDRTVQMELLALNKLGLIVPEGKARAISWIVVQN